METMKYDERSGKRRAEAMGLGGAHQGPACHGYKVQIGHRPVP